MAEKYRKLGARIWRDEKFTGLDEMQKLVAIYCLTAQVNRCGIFVFSPALAAEDLAMSAATFRKVFESVVERLRWRWDSACRVLWFPRWWRYNAPENTNVLSGCVKDMSSLPDTNLLSEFWANTGDLPQTVRHAFTSMAPERFRRVGGNVTPNPTPTVDETFPPTLPNSGAVAVTGAIAGTGSGPEEPVITFPAELDSAGFREVWDRWKRDRRERRLRKYTTDGEATQLKKLAPLGAVQAIACIEQSIANGWQGLFPEKFAGKGDLTTTMRNNMQEFIARGESNEP